MSELEEEMKPLKLQPELASYAGTVLYPDEESAKWDVDGWSSRNAVEPYFHAAHL